MHGLAEHSGRYGNPGDYFSARGAACYAVDCRGHGRSPGRRVHVGSFDEYLTDVRALLELARGRHPGLPAFAIGQSQGGLIVLRWALAGGEGLAGAVAASPFLATHPDAQPSVWLRAVAPLLAWLVPRMLVALDLDASQLSRDPGVAKAYRADPLVGRTVSPGWFGAASRAQREAMQAAPRLALPTLVMAGSDDRLADCRATQRFAAAAPADRLEFELWAGFYHETFHEPERERVFARIGDWLAARVGESIVG